MAKGNPKRPAILDFQIGSKHKYVTGGNRPSDSLASIDSIANRASWPAKSACPWVGGSDNRQASLRSSNGVRRGRARSRGRWCAPRLERGPLGRLGVRVAGSLFAVAILLLPTSVLESPATTHHLGSFTTFSGPTGTALGDEPGFLLPAQFAPPDNITEPGSFSLVQLAAGVLGTTSTYWVLYTRTVPGGHYLLQLQTGASSPTQAWQILSHGNCGSSYYSCFHHSVTWGQPRTIVNSSSAITADALAAQGAVLALAYSGGGTTTFETSFDGGTTWTTVAAGAGISPSIVIGGSYILFALMSAGFAFLYTQPLTCGAAGTWSTSGVSGQNVTPVQLPNGTMGAVVSNATTHLVQLFPLNAAHTSFLSGISIGSWASNSTSPIFTRIGATALATPGGWPGQLGATVLGQTTLALFTTSVGGTVEIYLLASRDSGAHWQGPYPLPSGAGAIQDPQLAPTPFGSALATWRSDDNGSWEIQQALIAPDGRPTFGPVSLTQSGGTQLSGAYSVAEATDALGRPFFAWIGTTPFGGQVLFDGADLGGIAAVQDLIQEIGDLKPADLGAGNQGAQGLLLGQLETVLTDLQTSQFSTAVTSLEGTVFPEVSSRPMVLDCDAAVPVNACTTLAPNSGSYVFPPVTGYQTPGSYIPTYLAWALEALGVGVRLPASAADFLFQSNCGGGGQHMSMQTGNTTVGSGSGGLSPGGSSVSAWVNASSAGSVAEAYAQPINPKAANLSLGWHFQSNLTSHSSHPLPSSLCGDASGICRVTFCNVTAPYSFTLAIRLSASYQGSGTVKTFNLVANTTVVRLTNLTYSGVTYYSATVTGHMRSTFTVVASPAGGCDPSATPRSTSFSNVTVGPGWGSIWTTLNVTAPSFVAVNSTAIWANWSSNLPSKSWFNFTTGAPHSPGQVGGANLTAHSFLAGGLAGGWYNITGATRSNLSAAPRSHPGAFDSFGVVTNNGKSTATTLTKSFCGLVSNQLAIEWTSFANVTANNATLRFFSNHATTSSVSISEMGPAASQVVSSIPSTVLGNGTYESLVELHGLVSWATYNVTITAVMTKCSINYLRYATGLQFQTPAQFDVWEADYPYDSISQEGGGSLVSWDVPSSATTYYSFQNGTIYYWPTSNQSSEVVVPVTTPFVVGTTGAGVNLTPTAANASYTFVAQLNYSLKTNPNTTYTATSFPYSFVYLRDSSGDGLTDAEKDKGWSVTTQSTTGMFSTRWTYADPRLQRTNGLVSDYVEKEFGLDPTHIDSAGSHMLDTWNLTFDLGSAASSPTLPENGSFQYWYANATYNFSTACAYPGENVSGCTTPLTTSISSEPANLSDNSPWAGRVLWGSWALYNDLVPWLATDRAQWLRAVTGTTSVKNTLGTYVQERTLTIWGKLSWGANPLATSTPQDGLPDGARVNPLYDEDLNVNFAGLGGGVAGSFGITACGSGLPQNSATALQFHISGAAGGYAGNNYSVPILLSQCPGGAQSTSYNLTLAVDNTAPTESVGISMTANVSTNSTPNLYRLPINGCHWSYNATVGMLNGTPLRSGASATYVLTGNPSRQGTCAGGAATFLKFGISEVPSGLKVRTWLWVPDDNSSLSAMPWGLKRYVAEQSLAVIVVNNTNPSLAYSSDSLPMPWGGAAQGLVFASGLSEILVPRNQYINSSLGAALSNRTIPNASVTFGPLLGAAQGGAVVNGSHAGSLSNLECYWESRSVSNAPPLCPHGHSGTAANQTATLLMLNASGWSTSNAGGLPSNSLVDSGTRAAPAIAAYVTLNVSSTLVGNQTQQLDALLAGLLDNATGGVNGTLQDVTTEVANLGLEPAINQALINQTHPGAGNFGVPVSHAVVQAPSGQGLFGLCWNSPVCVIFSAGVWLGFALNQPVAAGLLLLLVSSELASRFHLDLAARLASAIAQVGAAIASGLNLLLTYLVSQAAALLRPPVNTASAPSVVLAHAITSTVDAGIVVHNGGGNSGVLGHRYWSSFDTLSTIAMIVAAVITIVLSLLDTVSIGAGFLIGLVVGLIIQGLVALNPGGINTTIGSLGAEEVWLGDGMVNCSTTTPRRVGYSCKGGDAFQNASQPGWDVLAEIAASQPQTGLFATLVGVAFASAATGAGVTDAVGLALAFLGTILTAYLYLDGFSMPVAAMSVLADVSSLAIDFVGIKVGKGVLASANLAVGGMGMGIDLVSFGGDLVKLEEQ